MTLPASFPLSMSQIAAELGKSLPQNLLDPDVLDLHDGSAPISFSELLGASATSAAITDSGASGGTFSFGAASSSRRIFVFVVHGDTVTPPGTPTCSVDGAGATLIRFGSTGTGTGASAGAGLFTANPSGTSGVVSASWGGLPLSVLILRVTGYSATAHHTVSGSNLLSINIPANGLLVGMGVAGILDATGITHRDTRTLQAKSAFTGWNFPLGSQTGRSVRLASSTGPGHGAQVFASFAPL